MGARGRTFVVLVVAVTVGAALSWADDEPPGQKSRREQAFADLEKEVPKLVPLVKNVQLMVPCGAPAPAPRAKGKRPTLRITGQPFCPEKYAPHKAKLMALLDIVNANSGSDERAGAMISGGGWRDYTVSLETRLVDLANLKMNHKSADFIGKQCKAKSDAMLARAKAALEHKSLDEFEAARTAATKDQTEVREWVQHHDQLVGAMERSERNVRLFEPTKKYDKPWKPVMDALYASAKTMLDQYKADWVKASALCAEPNKGENHAEHRKLEDQLFVALRQQLDDDLAKWKEEQAKVMYRHDCKTMQQLQKDICELDGDKDNPELQEQVELQSEMMKNEMNIKVNEAWTAIKELRTRAGIIQARRNGRTDDLAAWNADLTKFVDEKLTPEEKAIEEVVDKGIARGARNPKIQLWINLGKQEHTRLEDDPTFLCALADVGYCAERETEKPFACLRWKRPDCVNLKECKIWEFKPLGARPKAKGMDQLDGGNGEPGYKNLIEKHYNAALELAAKDELTYEPVGGRTFFHELEKSSCVKDGKVTFTTHLHQYDKCEQPYECAPQAK